MKIMVVDDSKAMRALIRRTLHDGHYEQAQIGEAENGREALDSIDFCFITSDESEQNVERARRAGARFVIGKPFTRQALYRAVSEAARAKKDGP